MARSVGQDRPSAEDVQAAETESLFQLIDRQLSDPAVAPDANGSLPLATTLAPVSPSLLPTVRSLYTALACRDRATAEHSRRVAERMHDFAHALGLSSQDCLSVELAGLLHDVGKLGVPDTILFKSGELSADEKALVTKHRQMGIEAIRPLIDLPPVIDTLTQAPTWYDGSLNRVEHSGEAISAGARMLAIVDAYDAMTSDRAYRRAMPHDLAVEELARMAGKQFDPDLVARFKEFTEESPHIRSTGFWSADFGTMAAGTLEQAGRQQSRPVDFYSRVVNDLKDGVCFVRLHGQVFFWSKAAEQLTGYQAEEICEQPWEDLDAFRTTVLGNHPVAEQLMRDSIGQGRHRSDRITLRHKFGHEIQVELQVVPVVEDRGNVDGVALIFSDIRESVELETRFDELSSKATRDPLTGVYNRAEFDRQTPLFVKQHAEEGSDCSLVVADLDYFKEINDRFGHARGDAVLCRFARILSTEMGGDGVVARYGGEEFVILLPTPLDVAVRRCDGVRAVLAHAQFSGLGSRRVSSSFGVSDFQIGDTPETVFARADQALFMAKQQGRDRTIAIGAGEPGTTHSEALEEDAEDGPLETTLSVSGPQETVIRKLEGFIAEHRAKVLVDTGKTLELRVGARGPLRRLTLQADKTPATVTFNFRPRRSRQLEVHVRIVAESSLVSQAQAQARSRAILASLRTYLIAN